jgi:hypothetical protein
VFGSTMKLQFILAAILCLLLVVYAEEDEGEGKYLFSSSIILFLLRNKVCIVYFVDMF